jgi:hypothetical protein
MSFNKRMNVDKSPLGFHNSKMSSDKAQQNDIFKDKDKLLDIWKDERRSRDNSADLMWESLKFFSLVISGLITANTFFLGFIFSSEVSLDDEILLGYSLTTLALPILIIYLSWCGYRDLGRRWERTLEAIAHLTKLEDLLGLRKSIPVDIHVLSTDTHLFERYFKETKGFVSEEGFIIYKKTRGPNMFTHMRRVYYGLYAVGGLLLAIPVGLTIYFTIYYAFFASSQ